MTEVYMNRLKPNEIKYILKSYDNTDNKLCELRLKNSKLNVTKPWYMDDLNLAIKDLDNGKSTSILDSF